MGDANQKSKTNLLLHSKDLRVGDVLLHRFSEPDRTARMISEATGSVYTHAAIYLGDCAVAEAVTPDGVVVSSLDESLEGTMYVAVLRSQAGFGAGRVAKLKDFVNSVVAQEKPFSRMALIKFGRESEAYFENQLEFVRKNHGKSASAEDFAARSFFCSAFVVACYCVVGIIDETAQVAYPPEFFSPGHLQEDPTFGWLLGYLVPNGSTVPEDDELLSTATLWAEVEPDAHFD